MFGITAEEIVEFLREHPGVSAKRCFGMLSNKHVGMMREDDVEMFAEMLDNRADEVMRELAQMMREDDVEKIGLIRSEQNADGTVSWFVA